MRRTILFFLASFFLSSLVLPWICVAAEDSSGQTSEGAGRKWAFCIGVGKYGDPEIPALPSGAKNARGIAGAVKEHGGFDRVLVLTDETSEKDPLFPSRRHILELLNRAARNMRSEDMVLFSFSGNGCTDNAGKTFLLTPESRLENLPGTAVSMDEIMGFLKKAGVKRSIVFMDACRLKKGEATNVSAWGIYPDRYMRTGVSAIFYAAIKGYSSFEDTDSGYSVFAGCLIQGLQGGADDKYGGNKDRVVTLNELASYVNMAFSDWYMTTSSRQVPFVDVLDKGQAEMAISSIDKAAVKEDVKVVSEQRAPAPESNPSSPTVQAPPQPEKAPLSAGPRTSGEGPGTLTLEQPGQAQHSLEKLVYTPVLTKKDPLHLRAKPKDISIEEVKSILTSYGFYSTCWNYNGDFCNPSGDFQNQFHDNGDGTVSDSSTGLMWQKGGSGDGLTWEAARQFAQKMNGERFAGFSDWRIPTVEELASLMETSWRNGDLFVDPVFDRKQRQCWSLDTKGMESAWKANFHQGFLVDFPMDSTNCVRLVRSIREK